MTTSMGEGAAKEQMCACAQLSACISRRTHKAEARVSVCSWQDLFVIYGATGCQSDLSALWGPPLGSLPPAGRVQEALSGPRPSLRGCRVPVPTHVVSPGATLCRSTRMVNSKRL